MESRMKRAIALALALVVVMGILGACGGGTTGGSASGTPAAAQSAAAPAAQSEGGGSESGGTAGSDLNVGLIVGQLGDYSLSDQMYNGVVAAQDKYGFALDYTECEYADMAMVMTDYTESEEYDLIILMAYHVLDAANEITERYPDQKFLVYDIVSPGNPSMVTQSWAKDQIGFMAGVFAALMEPKGEVVINGETYTWTPSNVFGSMIGVEVPTTVDTLTGFHAGVHYINPEAEILYTTVGSWADQTKAKELAQTMIDGGVNIMFHNAGGSFLGALEAVKAAGKFAIGYDPQNYLDPVHILGSSARLGDAVFLRFFDDFVNGKWEGGTNTINGYHNGCAEFFYQDGLEVPEDVKAVMDEVVAKIQAEEIEAPKTWEELESFDLVYGG